MDGSFPFFLAIGVAFVLLAIVLVASVLVGSVRHRAGRAFSDEIEEAAGMGENPLAAEPRRPRRARRRAAA